MKRTLIAFSLLFVFGSVALLAQPESPRRFSNRLFNDVVQMTRAGLSDETIVAYVTARRTRLDADVSAEDLIALRRAGVHENVVRAIAGMSGLDQGSGGHDLEVQSDSSGDGSVAQPAEGEDYALPERPYPYWYAYGWYGYPYWWAYSPYFSTAIVVRGGRFHGGFGHRSFGHGGFRSGGGGHRGGGGHGGRR